MNIDKKLLIKNIMLRRAPGRKARPCLSGHLVCIKNFGCGPYKFTRQEFKELSVFSPFYVFTFHSENRFNRGEIKIKLTF